MGAYAPPRQYPRGVRRQVRRAAEARPERSWTGRLWQPIRTLYKREQLLDDWSEMQAPRRTPRIKKLDRGANATWSERDQDAVARADMRAVDRDWKRLEKAIAYLPKDERAVVRDALIVAHGAHAGQNRRSGEPFVSHPVAVSILLADLSMDRDTVVAGLLHDTVEDTFLRFEDVERRFGPDVRALVEGETKVSKLPKMVRSQMSDDEQMRSALDKGAASKAEEQVENMRSMFIAMADDWRIVVVKLADRLHNMRTLQYMPVDKRASIARETLEIFSPLAHRLGMWQYKTELADLSFK